MASKLTIPENSKETFSHIVKVLTPKWVAKKLHFSYTHIKRMEATGTMNQETRRDPVEVIELLIKGLVNNGHKYLAFCLIDRLAHLVCAELAFRGDHQPDKGLLIEEFSDDISALSHYHKIGTMFKMGKAIFAELRYAKKNAHGEIDQTFFALIARVKENKRTIQLLEKLNPESASPALNSSIVNRAVRAL